MHLMACHFIKALNIPSLARVKQGVHGKGKEVEVEEADKEAEASDSDDDELDIDTNMEVEASADDAEALREAAVTDFEPGDVVGKNDGFHRTASFLRAGYQGLSEEAWRHTGLPTVGD